MKLACLSSTSLAASLLNYRLGRLIVAMVKPPKPKPSSTLSNSPSATPHPTLASFLASPSTRSPSKRPLASSTASIKPTKKLRTPAGAKPKKVVSKKRVKAKVKPDNRNLGTMELLDTTDEDEDDVEVEELPEKEEKKGGKGTAIEEKKKDVKGKGKMMLEEEDWMGGGEDGEGEASPASAPKAEKGNAEASTSSLPPADIASSASSPAVQRTPSPPPAKTQAIQKEEPMEIEIQDDTDDDEVEILAVSGGGVEKCEKCGEVVEGLSKQVSHTLSPPIRFVVTS